MGCCCDGGSPSRGGFGRWLGTNFLDVGAGLADKIYGDRKRALFATLAGDVLELGPGTGANFRYYGRDVRWIGVEPNRYAREKLLKQAARYGIAADARTAVAERLDLADASMDAVVGTLVLCSVDDLEATLAEVLRVLRPGGNFVFIEHVAAPRGTALRRFQDAIAPAWRALADGCRANRETGEALRSSGFGRVEYESFRITSPMLHLAPHIAGSATRSVAADGV